MKISRDCFHPESINAETHIFSVLYEWQSTPAETANKVNEFAHHNLFFPPFLQVLLVHVSLSNNFLLHAVNPFAQRKAQKIHLNSIL